MTDVPRITLPEPLPWMESAACATAPTDLMFRHNNDLDDPWQFAREVCNRCPVVTDCLTHALDLEAANPTDRRHGMWGALSPDERAKLARGAA